MEKENETTKAAERAVAAEAGIGQISPIAEGIGQVSPIAEAGIGQISPTVEAGIGRQAPAAEAGAPGLGKFRSVEALLRAYNSLEAEFTRRSQRLRELEGKAAGENASPPAPAPAEEGASLEERVERAIERCLAAREAPYIMAGGGSFAAAPPRRARTLEEAGRLAQELFRK
ncbi:MAG TPA: hypothetical protein H9737_02080 [Candidatus Borkfalkia faecigallinarum]|uniref:Uncharacterized protein n=1 Tax=Candidatus Borkfalkia faecigallinarum TaxID=2838509 RepID=A0A9D1VT57_9FIRM|nr:hypothetical protein [Candidatus Borkfalkia faecigallinarum]